MSHLSANLTLKDAIPQVREMSEVRDESGKVIGYVVTPDYAHMLEQALYEQLEKADADGGEYTMEEVMALLGK